MSLNNSPSVIFLASNRSNSSSTNQQKAITYFQNHPNLPNNNINFIEDVFLAPNTAETHVGTKGTSLIILPIIGKLRTQHNLVGSQKVNHEKISIITFENENDEIEISNHFENDWINYLVLSLNSILVSGIIQLELTSLNNLFQLNLNKDSRHPYLHIGVFESHAEYLLNLKKDSKSVFCYVLNGVFEIENRLLENRDSIVFWENKTIEFEALAPHSILLIEKPR